MSRAMWRKYFADTWKDVQKFMDSPDGRVWPGEGINNEPFDSYPFSFSVNQKVQKRSGYRYPGVVVVRWTTRAGKPRYVVEADNPDFDGMFHIFSEEQLERHD